MAERITRELLADKALIHAGPVLRQPTTVDRNFEMPARLYVAMAALFFGYLAVMTVGFASPGMIVPMAINVVFVAMFFAVPSLWMRMKPDNAQRTTAWAKFQRDGIMTPFGRATAGAATVQMLILPALVFAWGVIVAVMWAVIR